jgi:hypothetical protein
MRQQLDTVETDCRRMKEIIDRKLGEQNEGTDSDSGEDEDDNDNHNGNVLGDAQMLKMDDDDTKTNTPSYEQSNSHELDERKSPSL